MDRDPKTLGAREYDVLNSPDLVTPATSPSIPKQQHAETTTAIPTDPHHFTEHWKGKFTPRLRKYTVRSLIIDEKQCKGPPLTESEVQDVTSHCEALLALNLNSQQVKACNLRNNIDAMLGRLNGKSTQFPELVVDIAQVMLDRFEAEGWGVGADAQAAASHIMALPGVPVPHSAPTAAGHLVPPGDHQIWGRNGIMRGLLATPNRTQPGVLDPKAKRKGHDVFGHNDLTVGQWWPYRVCALRDGAHGSIQGGISMKQAEGVYSVVISSAYEGLDQDQGSTVWYSMPGSADNKDSNAHSQEPAAIRAVKAMDLTYANVNKIRVLRTAGAGWHGRPVQGLRYDGLYKIVDRQQRSNSKGGLYWRYKLERLPNKVDLEHCRARPTAAERHQMDRIKAYW